jgi:hypothetical protein
MPCMVKLGDISFIKNSFLKKLFSKKFSLIFRKIYFFRGKTYFESCEKLKNILLFVNDISFYHHFLLLFVFYILLLIYLFLFIIFDLYFFIAIYFI